MAAYRVDRESLRFHTPPGTWVPTLIEDFYEWASTQPAGSMGFFELEGGRLDDDEVEDGSRSAQTFLSFMTCADGSRVGWWRPDGQPLDAAPVVVLVGDDCWCVGNTTEEFLFNFCARWTGIDDLQPEVPDAAGHARLLAWLDARGVGEARQNARRREHTAELLAWHGRWSAERAERARTDGARRDFAEALRAAIGEPPLGCTQSFGQLVLTAQRCALVVRCVRERWFFRTYVERQTLPLPSGFEERARAFRDHDTQELPDAGLWFHATFELRESDLVRLTRNYLIEPDEIELDDEGLKSDCLRMPRSPYWMPFWLARRTSCSPYR
jgi:hypothetical protein